MSAIYSITTKQKIPISLPVAWDFFSRPENLSSITPKHLGFQIISTQHFDKMYAGQVIEYTVKPILQMPIYWMTEITNVVELQFFVDEQRFGPYSLWHHQHHFKEIDGGIEMFDIIHYKLPLWFLGDVANYLFVRTQLKEIFSYRFKAVESIFGNWHQPQSLDVQFS